MQTGVVNTENLSQVLRGISQRRRQGVLEISYSDAPLHVFFVQGRIVDAIMGERNPVSEVADALRAGSAFEGELPPGWEECYSSLFVSVNEGEGVRGFVEEESFKQIVRYQVLNKLYRLAGSEGGYYSFKAQMVDYDKDFSPSISVGQLLLDLVAVANDTERMGEIFSETSVLALSGIESSEPLSEEEDVVMGHLEKDCSIEELYGHSMLSRYHFQDALLALYERGLVVSRDGNGASHPVPKAKEPTNGEASDLFGDDLMLDLESSIDNAFESASGAVEMLQNAPTARELPVDEADEEEFDDEDDFDDDLDVSTTTNLKVRLGVLSFRILNMEWIPHFIVVVFLCMAIAVPYVLWGEIFHAFGHR